MTTKVQKRIQQAYSACYRLCENDWRAEQWLSRALDAARRGEKQHRKIPSRYMLPIADAARYFVVKWFLTFDGECLGFADACALREDYLYARGARDRCIMTAGTRRPIAELAEQFADVVTLDYLSFTR